MKQLPQLPPSPNRIELYIGLVGIAVLLLWGQISLAYRIDTLASQPVPPIIITVLVEPASQPVHQEPASQPVHQEPASQAAPLPTSTPYPTFTPYPTPTNQPASQAAPPTSNQAAAVPTLGLLVGSGSVGTSGNEVMAADNSGTSSTNTVWTDVKAFMQAFDTPLGNLWAVVQLTVGIVIVISVSFLILSWLRA